MKAIFMVAAGSGFGGVLRYFMHLLITRIYPSSFPWGTFGVNIIGCLLIGLFFGLAEKGQFMSAELRLLLMTGLCGGFTTFSSFSIENVVLLKTGDWLNFTLYTAASITGGLLATYLGILLSKSI